MPRTSACRRKTWLRQRSTDLLTNPDDAFQAAAELVLARNAELYRGFRESMRYLTLLEVIFLHDHILAASGGAAGVRDLGALEAAIAQPKATFGGDNLYPTVIAKATTLCSRWCRGTRSSTETSASATRRWMSFSR